MVPSVDLSGDECWSEQQRHLKRIHHCQHLVHSVPGKKSTAWYSPKNRTAGSFWSRKRKSTKKLLGWMQKGSAEGLHYAKVSHPFSNRLIPNSSSNSPSVWAFVATGQQFRNPNISRNWIKPHQIIKSGLTPAAAHMVHEVSKFDSDRGRTLRCGAEEHSQDGKATLSPARSSPAHPLRSTEWGTGTESVHALA